MIFSEGALFFPQKVDDLFLVIIIIIIIIINEFHRDASLTKTSGPSLRTFKPIHETCGL